MSHESKSEGIFNIFRELQRDLIKQELSDEIVRFGGHPLRVMIHGQEQTFWSEFMRVSKNAFRTFVFRSITRLDPLDSLANPQGIRNLAAHKPQNQRILLIDQRSNLERELDPGTLLMESQSENMREAYQALLDEKIDALLTPVREGALGPTEKINSFGPFAETRARNNPDVWDIDEEVQFARYMHLAYAVDRTLVLDFARH